MGRKFKSKLFETRKTSAYDCWNLHSFLFYSDSIPCQTRYAFLREQRTISFPVPTLVLQSRQTVNVLINPLLICLADIHTGGILDTTCLNGLNAWVWNS